MGMAASGAGKRSVLDNLKAGEALNVLQRLLATHPNLKKEAESIARSLLGAAVNRVFPLQDARPRTYGFFCTRKFRVPLACFVTRTIVHVPVIPVAVSNVPFSAWLRE